MNGLLVFLILSLGISVVAYILYMFIQDVDDNKR